MQVLGPPGRHRGRPTAGTPTAAAVTAAWAVASSPRATSASLPRPVERRAILERRRRRHAGPADQVVGADGDALDRRAPLATAPSRPRRPASSGSAAAPGPRGARMPRSSQSPPRAVERTSSDSVGCAPTSSRTASVRSTMWLVSAPRPSTSTVTTSPGSTGRRVRRRARQEDVAGHERDQAGDVGDQVVHVPLHLVGVAVLADLAVDERADRLSWKSQSVTGPARSGTGCRHPSRAASSRRRCRGSRAARSRWRPCSRRCSRRPRAWATLRHVRPMTMAISPS